MDLRVVREGKRVHVINHLPTCLTHRKCSVHWSCAATVVAVSCGLGLV